ncbi:MAG: DUF6512 family protein [Anaerolineales bacterium]
MKTATGFRPWLKGLLFWVTFLLLYVLRKLAPVIPITLISGVNESNFQHYKATFFAYLILSLVEYLIFRKRVSERASYWYARLTAAIFAPWMVFLTWYGMAAVTGQMPLPLEILWGNVATLLVGILAAVFERGFEQITYGKSLKTAIWALFVISILTYIILTFRLPWADVFTEPDWQTHSLLLWRLYV